MDKMGGLPGTHTEALELVKTDINDNNLTDIWRHMHPEELKFTWKRLRPTPFVRLDYILVSELVCQASVNSDILPGFQTDHSIPVLYLDFATHQKGPGFWKFNTALLEDNEYKTRLNQIVNVELAQKHKEARTSWELLKLAIRNFTLKYAARKKKAQTNELAALEKILKYKEETLHVQSHSMFSDKEQRILRLKQSTGEIMEQKGVEQTG